MKASQIYINEFYAWYPEPKKGQFTMGGMKVKVLNVQTRKYRGDSNARTWVKVIRMSDEKILEVRARELLDFWDAYEAEVEAINKEREERQAQAGRKRVRYDITQTLIAWKLQERTGMLTVGSLKYYPHNDSVMIPASMLISWLGISEEMIEDAVSKHMEIHEEVQTA